LTVCALVSVRESRLSSAPKFAERRTKLSALALRAKLKLSALALRAKLGLSEVVAMLLTAFIGVAARAAGSSRAGDGSTSMSDDGEAELLDGEVSPFALGLP